MRHRFPQLLAASWPPTEWARTRVLVAVSGGPDSVALLRGLAELAHGEAVVSAAHFHHGLRPGGDEDLRFVQRLCNDLNVPLDWARAGDDLTAGRESVELEARAARYEFLVEVSRRRGARYVVTGHTADDQAETVLHRILRGTGLEGLAGIPRARELTPGVTLLRPMLKIARSECLDFLQSGGFEFRVDESNQSLDHTRNRIRLETLPRLAGRYNPGLAEALRRLATLARESHVEIVGLADQLLRRAITHRTTTRVALDRELLRHASAVVTRESLRQIWRMNGWPERDMGFEHWRRIEEVITRDGCDRLSMPGGVRVDCQEDSVLVERDPMS